MTSEVLIMNEMGVTLAADSAATVGGEVFTANKLHRLSDTQPVAVMVYGVSSVDGVPIELLIGEYRRRLGTRTYSTVKEYAEDFIRFLSKGAETIGGPIIADGYRARFIQDCIHLMVRAYTKEIRRCMGGASAEVARIDEITERYLDEQLVRCHHVSDVQMLRDIADCIDKAIEPLESGDSSLSGYHLWNNVRYREKLAEIMARMFVSNDSLGMDTGLVFAGFGTDEYTPSYVEYSVHGLIGNHLGHSLTSESSVDSAHRFQIRTFAQDDAMKAFLTGISPSAMKRDPDG